MKIIGNIEVGDSVLIFTRPNEEPRQTTVKSIGDWSVSFEDETNLSRYHREDSNTLVIKTDDPRVTELKKDHQAYQVITYLGWRTSRKLENTEIRDAVINLMDLINAEDMNDDLDKLHTLSSAKKEPEYIYRALEKLHKEQ